MPIPVLIPTAHSRLTIAAPCSRPQVMAAQPMAVHPHHALPFGAHAMALKSQFRPTASPRFPGAVVQAPHLRTMGAPHVHHTCIKLGKFHSEDGNFCGFFRMNPFECKPQISEALKV